MNGRLVTDAQISQALRAHVPERAQAGLRERTLDEIHRTRQRSVFGPSRIGFRFGPALGAAAAVVVIAIGGTLLIQRSQPVISGPSPTIGPSPSPSQAAVVVRSATPAPTPTATPTLLPWTQASLNEDWPAPVRAEPAGGAVVRPILLNIVGDAEGCCKLMEFGREFDLTNDTMPDVVPWVDIEVLSLCAGSCLDLWLPGPPPNVDPAEQWIAYGLVTDDDGDGIGDRRIGVDNVPLTAGSAREHRTWITDLHTGLTVTEIGDSYGLGGFTFEGTAYPGASTDQPNGVPSCPGASARFRFAGGDIAGGGTFSRLPGTFYGWSSVIIGGRVVATDYTPDTGWLHPASKAPPTAPHPDDRCPAG
jgi:hypothetical protein